MDDTATLSLKRVVEGDGQPSVLTRHLVGLAVLLLTVVPAYMVTRPEGVPPLTAEAEAEVAASVGDDTDDPVEESTPRLNLADIHAHIREVAVRHNMSPLLVAAIIEAESEFNPRAVSRKGARGLMQLMPATASSLAVHDSFDPYENIEGGVRHLRRLLDRFHGNVPLAVAAYNAGEQAVINYGGVPPYRETRRYVARVLRRMNYKGVTVVYGSATRRVASAAGKPDVRPAAAATKPVVRPAAATTNPDVRPAMLVTANAPEPRRQVLGPWAPPAPMIRPTTPAASAPRSGGPSAESP